MKIEYEYTPQFTGDGVVYIPRVLVLFSNKATQAKFPVYGIIDSGASVTVMHSEIGARLGIDVTQGESMGLEGVGGVIPAYKHSVTMKLGDDPVEHEIECAFAELKGMDVLLGQYGFFDKYKVVFEGYKRKFSVESRP